MKRLLPLAAALLVANCYSFGYSVILVNSSNARVDGFHVKYGHFRSVGGTLPPQAEATHIDVQEPIPARAEVTWIDAQKTEHRAIVAVKSALPKRFRGDLQFEILNGGKVVVTGVPPYKKKELPRGR